MNWTDIVIAMVGVIFGGGIVGWVNAKTNRAKVDGDLELAERALLNREWQALRSEVKAELESCHAQRVALEARLALTEQRATAAEVRATDLAAELTMVRTELEIVRRQIGEVAEAAPGVWRTRATDVADEPGRTRRAREA